MQLTPTKQVTVTFRDEELKALNTVADILETFLCKLDEENSEYFCNSKVDDINDNNLLNACNLIRDIYALDNETLDLS